MPDRDEEPVRQPAGIVERLVRDDVDRKRFLKMAGGAGATSFGAFVLAACGSTSKKTAATAAVSTTSTAPSSATGDIAILNYALTLEYLESSYYNEVAKKGVVKTARGKHLLKTVVKDENDHVALLKKALGSKAVKKPKFDFGKATSSEAEFAAVGYVLENTGVHAYLGQAANIKTQAYLLVAAEIVTVEGRHAGAFGLYNGKAIAPTPLDSGWTASKVLAAVKGTKFIKS
jgi:hypothetical protein